MSTGMGSNGVTVKKFLHLLMILEQYLADMYPGVHIFSCNQDNFLAVGLGCWTK